LIMLIICTPVYRGDSDISPETRATVRALRDAGLARPEWVIQPGPLVFDNRNKTIVAALKIGEWSHVLFLDADIAMPRAVEDVRRMLDRSKDIVCGPYTMRCEVGAERICAARYGKGHVAPGASGLHAVDWAGGGCMLISRAAIDKLGPLWFRHEFIKDGSDQSTEDVGFCMHAKREGYEVWLDCDVQTIHHGLPQSLPRKQEVTT